MRRFLCLLTLVLSGLSAFATSAAHASTFDVSPIMLNLSAKVASGMISVTNQSTEALRFQVTAFAWDQRADGEMVLTPTKDVVFFPAMLTLNPTEARNIRVGVNVAPGAAEKSYRVFVQELPPLVKQGEEGVVRVLTKMGIPVFLEAEKPKATPTVGALNLSGDQFSFSLKNAGNAHFRAEKILIVAKDGSKAIHMQEVPGWYVLAAGTRNYDVKLPKAACDGLKSINVEVVSDEGNTQAALANARCGS
jgi:fimbrial chaperone protein